LYWYLYIVENTLLKQASTYIYGYNIM